MAKDNINVVESQILERLSQAFNDVLAGKSFGVGSVNFFTEKDLGSQHKVMSWDIEAVKSNTDLSFCFSVT